MHDQVEAPFSGMRAHVRAELTRAGLRQLSVSLPVGGLGTWIPMLMFAGVRAPHRNVWAVLDVLTGLCGGVAAWWMLRRFANKRPVAGWHVRLLAAPHLICGLTFPAFFRPEPSTVQASVLVAQTVVMIVLYGALMAWDIGFVTVMLVAVAVANPFMVSPLNSVAFASRVGASVAICIIVAGLAVTLHRALRTTIELQFRNAALVTELTAANAELLERSQHDALTGLANRGVFEHGLLQPAQTWAQNAGVLYVDVDEFKTINDTHGHAVGDEVLVRVAEVLRSATRPTDVVSRLGGDEFAVLVRGADREALEALGERVLRVLAESPGVTATASIGAAIADLSSESPESVRARADAALYEAKRAGRNCIRFAREVTDRSGSGSGGGRLDLVDA